MFLVDFYQKHRLLFLDPRGQSLFFRSFNIHTFSNRFEQLIASVQKLIHLILYNGAQLYNIYDWRMIQQIKTLRQIHEELKDSIINLKNVFNEIGVKPMKANEDFQKTKVTLEKAMNDVPKQELLTPILKQSPFRQDKEAKISMYSGDYELIKKAKQNFSKLKNEQKNIYFLAAKLRLPQISKEYKYPEANTIASLNSYQIMVDKKTKAKYFEKNTVSELFSSKEEQHYNVIDIQQTDIIKQNDFLITVCFYDSHNGRKQHEFICLQNQKLSQLAESFYCMISQLSVTKSKQLSYFVIGPNIYYEGNKTELQALINKAWTYNKIKYYLYQMKKTAFHDLRLVLGQVYLYRHLGGCDHMIIFKEGRIFHQTNPFNDVIEKRKYPIICFESKMKKKKCQACSQKFANLSLLSDPLKKGDTSFFCSQCSQDLHSQNNKVIPYIHQ